MDLSDSLHVVVLIGFTAVETVFLLAVIALVQARPDPRRSTSTPGPPADPPPPSFRTTLGTTGPERRLGFIPRFGLPLGGVICFVVLLALTAVTAVPGGALLSVVGWWVAALTLFKLTVRQTFKANIALGLLTIALVLAIESVSAKGANRIGKGGIPPGAATQSPRLAPPAVGTDQFHTVTRNAKADHAGRVASCSVRRRRAPEWAM